MDAQLKADREAMKAKLQLEKDKMKLELEKKKLEVDAELLKEVQGHVLGDDYKRRRKEDLKGQMMEEIDEGDYDGELERMKKRKEHMEREQYVLQMRTEQARVEVLLHQQEEDGEMTRLQSQQGVEAKRREREFQEKLIKARNDAAEQMMENKQSLDIKTDRHLQEQEDSLEAQITVVHRELAAKEKRVNAKLDILKTNAKIAATEVEFRKKLAVQIEATLEITNEDMKKAESIKKKLQCAKIMFLMVILGCELDLYGFALAFITYWHAGYSHGQQHHQMHAWLIHCMLRIGPIGYFLGTAMYMAWTYGCVTYFSNCICGVDSSKTDLERGLLSSTQRVTIKSVSGKNIQNYNQLDKTMQREPVRLKFYHFMPIFRYYLLVKDAEANDVESLFRVNALSTFTLGFTQVSCFILGYPIGMIQIDIMIGVGMFAQCVNFFMTGVFFFTAMPEFMKSSMDIDAFSYSKRQAMAAESNKYQLACDQYAISFGEAIPSMDSSELSSAAASSARSLIPADSSRNYTEPQQRLLGEVAFYRTRAIREINELSRVEVDLSSFSTQQLFEWRKKLAVKSIARYADLAGI